MVGLLGLAAVEAVAGGITWPRLLQRYQALTVTPTHIATPVFSQADQAQALVQQYYNYINQHDYQDAYQLWRTKYQNDNSYNSFASGYSNSVLDNIVFTGVTPLPDGTVAVSLQLSAEELGGTGTVTHVFKGSYIVGQENGRWKLFSGTFQEIS